MKVYVFHRKQIPANMKKKVILLPAFSKDL